MKKKIINLEIKKERELHRIVCDDKMNQLQLTKEGLWEFLNLYII